ncbi:MAG TPA: tetratricopeptide repeat protein, partial [Micromonosporaceae bacterium]|nr:tetratricopeptide repeat protein [Micromonosporaceae bacterium]
LIVLDNARDAAQVRPLLPGSPRCLVLVTSRNRLTGLVATEDAYPITLDLLTQTDALRLLADRLGEHRVAAEPRAVEEIISRCARLPLALTIAAARAASQPGLELGALAADLYDGRRLDALDIGDAATDVRTVFSWSYQQLSLAAARQFRLLGLHPGPDVSAAAAASLAGIPPAQVSPPLAELTRAHLLIEHTPGRFSFHDLLRAYAAELSNQEDPPVVRDAAMQRMFDHYLHTAHISALLLSAHRDPITVAAAAAGTTPEQPADHRSALDWFTVEYPVLLAVAGRAAGCGSDIHAWQLAWTMAEFLDRQGQWRAQATVQRAALAAATRLADPTARALAYRFMGHAYFRLGRHDEALINLRHALNLSIKAGDQVNQGHAHMDLLLVSRQQGRDTEALDHVRAALELYRAAGHRRGQANALNALGWTYSQLGDHRQALESCQQALELHRQIGFPYGQATTLDSLGYAHHHLGHHTEAVTCYLDSIRLFQAMGNRPGEAVVLTHLGDTYRAAGNDGAAQNAWQQALEILDEFDHPDAAGVRAQLDSSLHRNDTV